MERQDGQHVFGQTMDVVAMAMLERFVKAFPNASYEAIQAHVADSFDWALEVPRLQAKMASLIANRSGQRTA